MKNKIINNRKWKHGTVSVVLTVLILVSVIILNVIATVLANHYSWMYIDMTSEQLFTLSDECQELLDRSFVKIIENRKSLNESLPLANYEIAKENTAAAEENITVAELAVETAKANIEIAKLNKLVFEQNVIKARTNLNVAESNLELATRLCEYAAELAGRAEDEQVAEEQMTELEKLASENLAIANENLNAAKENLDTVADNAKTAKENAENQKYNEQNALKEGDEGYRPMKDYRPIKDYKPFKETELLKEEHSLEFLPHSVYENLALAEENLEIANKNLNIAEENLTIAKANEAIAKANSDKNVINGESGYEKLNDYKASLDYISFVTVSNFTEPHSFATVKKTASFSNERELYNTDVKVKIIFCDLPDNIKNSDTLNIVYETAKDLADRFPKYIEIEHVDIWNNATSLQKYKTTSYSTINSTNVIIESGTEFRVCNLKGFYAFDTEDQSTPWGYNGEKVFASNILAVAQAESPIACVTVNHAETFKDYQLLYTLQDAGYKVETIDLAYQEIPDDCRLLVIYDPHEDLMVKDAVSDISEIEKVDRFLDGTSCAMMVFVDPDTPKLTNLEEYLEEWGIVIDRHTDNLGDTYGSTVKESSSTSLTTDGFTFAGTYVKEGTGGSIYDILSKNSVPPQVVFKNSTSLSYSELYDNVYVEPDDQGNEGYWCATYASNGVYRTIYDIFVTSNGAVSMADGSQVASAAEDPFKLMTITRERQMKENEAVYSSVMVCASTDFATEAMLTSAVYGNTDVLLATSRDMGEEFVPVDLDYKVFASTTISSMTAQSKTVWTWVLVAVPAVIMLGVGVFVLVRRKYS